MPYIKKSDREGILSGVRAPETPGELKARCPWLPVQGARPDIPESFRNSS